MWLIRELEHVTATHGRGFAPAKINLSLHVTGRRHDGFHNLDSLIAFADIGDQLSAEAAPDLSLAVDGPWASLIPDGADNLVLRAADALRQAAAAPGFGARLTLRKVLPVAAGIGGGSSDAAAALRLLVDLWETRISDRALHSLGASLGSDIPVCLLAGPARISGVGDQLLPIPSLPPAWFVLVNPRQAVATGAVFAALRDVGSPPPPMPPVHCLDRLAEFLRICRNDLEGPAIGLAPVIADVLAALRAQPACLLARMSGSGGTCFGLFPSAHAAHAAAQELRRQSPNWWIEPAAMLGRRLPESTA